MIQFHFKDEIFYLKDEQFSISSLLIILMLLSPILITMFLKNKDKYKNLNTENKECIFEINRLLLCYSYLMILCLLIRFSYIDENLSVNGFLYDKNVKIDCSDKPFDCCEIYDKCYNDNNNINSDTYIYNIKKGGQCNTLSEIILLNYKEENCEDSEFGCCYIKTSCDSYMRKNFSYYEYSIINSKKFPHGYMNTGEKKIDKDGSNCNNIEDIILDHVNKNDYIFRYFIMIIILVIIIGISFIYRKKIVEKIIILKEKTLTLKEKYHEKNDKEYNDLTLEPDEEFNDTSSNTEYP